jgi:O-antigen/teichoic acid export membrane protein
VSDFVNDEVLAFDHQPRRSPLASRALWSAMLQTLPQIYTLVQSVVAARVLGPNDMGRQSFIAFVALTVNLFVTGGLPAILSRQVGELVGSRRREALRALSRWALRTQSVLALIGAGFVAAIGLFRSDLVGAWIFAALACGFAVLHTAPYSVLVGTQRWRQAATLGLCLGGFGTAATVAVLLLGGGITGMFAIESVVAALSFFITVRLAAAATGESDTGEPVDAEEFAAVRRKVLHLAVPMTALIAIEIVVWRRSEFFLLERYGTATQLAQYSIAFAVANAVTRIPQGLVAVLAPAVATMYGADDHAQIRASFSRAIRLVALLLLPMLAGSLSVGPSLLGLVYGPEYRAAQSVLVILLLGFPMVPLASLAMSVLEGMGLIRRALLATAVAAVVDVSVALTLIPSMGERGAAWANVAAQLAAGTMLLALAINAVGGADVAVGRIVRAAVAAGLGGIAADAIDTHLAAPALARIVVAVVVGGAVFLTALRVLRGVAPDDGRWLVQNTPGRVARGVRWYVAPFQ